MRKTFAFLFLWSLLVLFGCQETQQAGGVFNPKPAGTIVSLSPDATEIIVTNAMFARLVGRTKSCNYPNTVVNTEVVCDVKPDYERIAELKPDLIVYNSDLFNAQDIEKLKALKLQTLEMNVHTLEDLYAFLYQVGKVTGSETDNSDMVEKIRERATSNLAVAPNPPVRVAVLLAGLNGDHYIAGKTSFVADVVKNCGGELIGPDSNKFEKANVEDLATQDPELILVPGGGNSILNDARLKNTTAVKKKQVGEVAGDILLRAGSRVEVLLRRLGDVIRQVSEKR